MKLRAKDLSFAYGTRRVLNHVSLELRPGITALVGPNAAGKTTLLKCLGGLLTSNGQITFDARPLTDFSRKDLSRVISYLPQAGINGGSLSVFEVVLLGRLHDLSWRVSAADIARVQVLLEELSLSDLAGRMFRELSGGQAQRVLIAQALIREPAVLLLDEPTSNLDLLHQFEVCTRILELTQSRGMITVVTMHDLNLASRFADQMVVLNAGEIHSVGTPMQVLTPEMMAEVYRVDVEIKTNESGCPHIIVRGPQSTPSW